MTIEEAKDKVIKLAESQIGYHEGANNQNQYADGKDMKKLYGWNIQNQPWCDIFVDWLFIDCFGYDVGSAMTYQFAGCSGAACAQSASYYKARGAFYDRPERGDQVFFYVSGGINHTGIVTSVSDTTITTVEGNTSDSVARRTYDIGSTVIAGYGRPKWALVEALQLNDPGPGEQAVPSEKEQPETIKITLEVRELSVGDTGPLVKLAQTLLESNGCTCGWYGCDGDFGPGTMQAVKNFQTSRKLKSDGIIGKNTWTALVKV